MKFVAGDLVTWASEHFAKVTKGKETIGDGPFKVKKVEDNRNPLIGADAQFVTLDVNNTLIDRYSGSFFKKVD